MTVVVMLICAAVSGAIMVGAQQQRPQHDPLGFLKRAITEANAPALSADQETQLTTLITNLRNSHPQGPDETLKAAHTAFNAAVLAGDQAAANAQATIIANRTGELDSARLQTLAKFQIDVLAILKAGGQLDALKQKFGDHLLGVIGPLGGPPFGGHPGGPGGPGGHGPGPGFGPRFAPGGRPGGNGQN
jgi:Spy/CpxP family protein refolding chaperone